MLKIVVFSIVAVALVSAGCQSDESSEEAKEQPIQWTGAPLIWPCPSTQAIYKNTGRAISKHAIATRAQIYKDQVYLAFPRYKCGIAATLATTSLNCTGCSAILAPYPCWSMQEEGNCNALQSIVDLYIDGDVLWVLDTGIVNSLEHPIRHCAPKVVAFCLKTNKILQVINLGELVCAASRLQYLVVDHASDGRCFIYISDAATRAILVYNVSESKGYRVVLPKAITEGCVRRDVLYLALARKSCGDNVLYFTYLCSNRVFSIRCEYLRSGSTKGHVHDVGIKATKFVILGTDGGSCVFFRYEGGSDLVYKWDANTCFKEHNFVPIHRSSTCMLATHIYPDYKRGQMRTLESNFPDYIQDMVGCGAIQQINVIKGCY